MERMMKVQEVILKAMAGSLKWWEAAEIIGVTDRTMRRWRERYEAGGYDGLYDHRQRRPSPKRVPLQTAEKGAAALPEKYFDFNVRHFHEKLSEEHGGEDQLQVGEDGAARSGTGEEAAAAWNPPAASAAASAAWDAAAHRCQQACLVREWAVLRSDYLADDATSEVYYAQLVEEEGTRTLMPAVQEVIQQQGLFCALYRDRASHFFVTPKAGGKVDESQVTQLGRALQELRIKMIPAYSPQARGRMERSYRIWQGRLPQELRLRKITTVEEANQFLRQQYREEFNRRFAVAAQGKGSAFVRTRRKDLGWVFSIQHERRVNPDNTITLDNRILQIEKSRWRNTLAGCTVRVYELMDGTVAVRFGPHEVARWAPGSVPAPQPRVRSGAQPLATGGSLREAISLRQQGI
jgi:hypothetical protein